MSSQNGSILQGAIRREAGRALSDFALYAPLPAAPYIDDVRNQENEGMTQRKI